MNWLAYFPMYSSLGTWCVVGGQMITIYRHSIVLFATAGTVLVSSNAAAAGPLHLMLAAHTGDESRHESYWS